MRRTSSGVCGRVSALIAVAAIGGSSISQLAQPRSVRLGGMRDDQRVDHLPDRITLTGVVRDFRADHPDFQRQPKNAGGNTSFGHYAGIAAQTLGAEGTPVFRSKGHKVLDQWRNSEGARVMPGYEDAAYISSRNGDRPGATEAIGDAVESADSFDQWFRDVSGVNLAKAVTITLNRDAGTTKYVFDDRTDPFYKDLGGFFPINGQLYGDYERNTNSHFTFEIDTRFTYRKGRMQFFLFDGDDDVWVFIDGKLVIDLGGVHSRIDQRIELDRLTWLEDGKTYALKFFFAERHTTQSNFRIETDLTLRSVTIPTASAMFD